MRHQLLHNEGGQRTLVAVLSEGEEVVSCLTDLARSEQLSAAHLEAIGAFSSATLAYFEWETKSYQPIAVREQVEVLTLLGDIALDDKGEPKLHLHTVLGCRAGNTVGGHLFEAHVRPTLEVMITESRGPLKRAYDPRSGLALIDLVP